MVCSDFLNFNVECTLQVDWIFQKTGGYTACESVSLSAGVVFRFKFSVVYKITASVVTNVSIKFSKLQVA